MAMPRRVPRTTTARGPGRSLRSRARGIALVELVLVIPLALVLVMATAELGRALVQYNALNKAVREGARYLASTALLGSTGVVRFDTQTSTATRNLVVYGNVAGTGTPRLTGLATDGVALAVAAGGSASLTASFVYQPIFMRIPAFGYGADLQPAFTLQAGMVTRAL